MVTSPPAGGSASDSRGTGQRHGVHRSARRRGPSTIAASGRVCGKRCGRAYSAIRPATANARRSSILPSSADGPGLV